MKRRERPSAGDEIDPREEPPPHRPRRARSPLLAAEPGTLGALTDEDRERWRIRLVAISPVGDDRYRLDFVEGAISKSVVLEYIRRTHSVIISREFADLFDGQATAHEAVRALARFIEGQAIEFPVEIPEDGGYRGKLRG